MQAKLIAFFILILSSNVLGATFRKEKTTTTTTTTETSTATNTTSETTDKPGSASNDEKVDNAEGTRASKLTGIPQLDWVYDPNLPRELRGYNLSSYPFLSTTPPEEDIHFKCDGLHDGFYAAIEFKCQVYHHCVYGIRHDFLCANFTAFDQKTFICHFVSDVDCEGSKKYWNRNDALYMPTTTSSTSTTTTEPPPTQRRRPVRPSRPLRRPLKRRPIDDYYYDEEYDDEYYEEPVNRRRKPSRQRPKKPFLDYEDDYEQERPRESENTRRHQTNRNRFRDEVDELEEDYDSPRVAAKAPAVGERRKSGGRVPIAAGGGDRQGNDERRSFANDERPARKEKPRVVAEEEDSEPEDTAYNNRRTSGRRRANEKRGNNVNANEQQADDFRDDKTRSSPKPLDEYVTPKASGQSVFARPRVPPRIPRPVPINEKNKFQYPVQKAGTTPMPSDEAPLDADYYDEEDYGGYGGSRGTSRRRRIQDSVDTLEERGTSGNRKRFRQDARPKPQNRARNPTRKPATEKKVVAAVEYEDYDTPAEESVEHVAPVSTRRPSQGILGRRRTSQLAQVAAEDEETLAEEEVQPVAVARPKNKSKSAVARDHRKKQQQRRPAVREEEAIIEDADVTLEEEPVAYVPERKSPNKSQVRSRPKLREPEPAVDEPLAAEEEEEVVTEGKSRAATPVRVVKRPFLPSRGGSPYLPRGLQAVGIAPKSLNSPHPYELNHFKLQSRDSVDVDVGPTISTIRMLEHGALVFRHAGSSSSSLTTVAPKPQPVNSQEFDVGQDNDEPIYDDDDDDDVNGGGGGSSVVVDDQQQHEQDDEQQQVQVQQQQHQQQLKNNAADEIKQEQDINELKAQDPQATLDMLYENDYDVTINDALNPTLKPLTSIHHQRNYAKNNVNNFYASTSLSPLSKANQSTSSSSSPLLGIINSNNYYNNYKKSSSSTTTSSSSSSSSSSPSSSSSSTYSSSLSSASPNSTSSSSSSSSASNDGTVVASNHIVKTHQTPNSPSINQQAQHNYYGQQQSSIQLYNNNNNNNKYYNNRNLNSNHNKNYNHKDDSHFSSTDFRRRSFIQAPSATTTSQPISKNIRYLNIQQQQQQRNNNYNNNNKKVINKPVEKIPPQYDDEETSEADGHQVEEDEDYY